MSFPIVLSNGPPDPAGLKAVSDAGVTTIRTGREGYTCARAPRMSAGNATAPIAISRNRRRGNAIYGPPESVADECSCRNAPR